MGSGFYILNADGEPEACEDVLTWAHWMGTADRHVAQDLDEGTGPDDPKRIRVSTVFLGIDHDFFGSGIPVLWETMVFGGLLDGEQRRYQSRAEALRGHQTMCQRVMESYKP